MPKLPPGAKPVRRVYGEESVLDAATRRIRLAFDLGRRVSVSVSGGKDSLVLADLVLLEAERRRQDIDLLFVDQEAEYAGSIAVVEALMGRPYVRPCWYQVPLRMTNSTSGAAPFLHAWAPEAEEDWIHPRHPLALTQAPGAPDRFQIFLNWFERQAGRGQRLSFIGLRADESLHRFIAATRFPGHEDWRWTSRGTGQAVKAYPLYDWAAPDVWRYVHERGLAYNPVYDALWRLGLPARELRVSNLIHEMSFHSLTTLQEIEPQTYERLCRRLPGIHAAALYGKEDGMYRAGLSLPAGYASWREYRDVLLTRQSSEAQAAFLRRFAAQPDTAHLHRQQVRQLLINDAEGNLRAHAAPRHKPTPSEVRQKWMNRL